MAADSTVTMGRGVGQKTFASANKIFTLSKYEPIGVMVFGNASFMQVPWETVIKNYRARIRKRKYPALKDYGKDFIRFLSKYTSVIGKDAEVQCFTQHVVSYFIQIIRDIDAEISLVLESSQGKNASAKREIAAEEINKIAVTVIKQHHDRWKGAEYGPGMNVDAQRSIQLSQKALISDIMREMFGKFSLPRGATRHLRMIAGSVATKFLDDSTYSAMSGVVVAGFGTREVFPSYIAYEIEGIMNGRLKYRESAYTEIGSDYENGGAVAGFAQAEDVASFMDGIHPQYRKLMDDTISRVLVEFPESIVDFLERRNGKPMNRIRKNVQKISGDLREKIKDEYRKFQSERFSDPIIMTISGLPKDELARVAENLVNLATIRQRYSPGMETVGGPIDVAVISKGDGFVWIERKHYFDAAKNPQFFAKYYMR